VKRLMIRYDGTDYSVGHADLDEIKARVLTATAQATPFWLRVNHGEGTYQETDLLIFPGCSIAITGIDAD
jgi:hypothetical protein